MESVRERGRRSTLFQSFIFVSLVLFTPALYCLGRIKKAASSRNCRRRRSERPMGIVIKKWSPSPDSGHFLTLIDVRKKVMICASKSESFSQPSLGNRTFVWPGKTAHYEHLDGNRECSFLPNSFPRIRRRRKTQPRRKFFARRPSFMLESSNFCTNVREKEPQPKCNSKTKQNDARHFQPGWG